LACEAIWDECDFLMNDFNAKHDSWNPTPRPGRMCISDCQGMWVTEFCNGNGLRVQTVIRCTFRNITASDVFIRNSEMRVSYHGKAGIEHAAVIVRLDVNELVDMRRRRPARRRIQASDCDDILEPVDFGCDIEMWLRLKCGVDALTRSEKNVGQCPFWNHDLQCICSDLNRLSHIKRRLLAVSDHYKVVRSVDKAMLWRS